MKKLQMNTVVVLASPALALLLIGLLSGYTGRMLNAAPPTAAVLTAVQDSYTDLNAPTTNFDGGLLNAANSNGGPEKPDVSTKYIFVEFDLSGVTFPINSAKLSLSTITCGGQLFSDEVSVSVYGVDNSAIWVENNLNWDNQPALSTSKLASVDGGVISGAFAQTATWTDYNQGALSAWLESQRGANNGRATLVVVIDNSSSPGLADVFFEDSEGSGAASNCADGGILPTLDVSESVSYFVFLPVTLQE